MKQLLPPFGMLVALACALLQPAQAGKKEIVLVPETRAPAPPPRPASAPARPASPGKDSGRLQKLRQLTFDRRPSSILKAWSHVPSEEPKKKDDDKKTIRLELDMLPVHFFLGNVEAVKTIAGKLLDVELAELQRQVTLGQWNAVKTYLAKLPEDEAKAGYAQLLQSLGSGPPMSMPGGMMPGMMHPMMMQFGERNKFAPDDVIALAALAPKELEDEQLERLGSVLRQAIAGGHVVEHAAARLQAETKRPKDQAALTVRQAAKVLMAADQAVEAGGFLPKVDEAVAAKDYEALNLLTRHFVALHARERKTASLEKAWSATQAVLAVGGAKRSEVEEALKRAVELAPKLREELGQKWLDQSFTSQPQRGMDILATIGAHVAQGMQTAPMAPEVRLKAMQLQKTAVEALLKAAPEQAKKWRPTLSLLAGNWLKEAEFSHQFDRSTMLGPRLRRDMWGNFYYAGEEPMHPMMMQQQQNMPRAVVTGELLDTKPTDAWIQRIDHSLRPKLAMTYAQLYLKMSEEAKALPYIEQLRGAHEEKAAELVKEFLRVWTRNHNPNSAREYTNPYMFMFGFERRAESIPLTRSKQERNLVELADLVKRLRALKIGELDEELLAQAFTTCHSTAEVYRLDAIETVFGPLAGIKPKTLAGLAQQMRENLGGLWREPAVQKDKKTNRKTKDIQAEVLRGYALARTVIDQGLKKFPGDWSLQLAHAALLHDENNYHQELAKSSGFSPKRQEAFAAFQRAAADYAAKAKDLAEDDESTRAYEQWFYASLGASDLQHVKEDKLPDLRQPALIRKAILALPGEAAERHLGKFANTLFTRLSSVNPAVKFGYLKGGFEIVGDHKLAHEAKKVYDYYKDLVTEIKLDAVIDGSDAVGQQPFGVFVNLRHTREIERESGGFGRYLQNQNSGLYWAYNYGRPTADYRDKFQAVATEALKEHFDVLSVTFQSDKVNSRALPEYGWRYTPYAYLLLKARGPQVDKLPPLRLNLDFLDTSGYVIIPVESPALPLDASVAKADKRPARKVQITQILDERQSDKGKLIVEIKAAGQGLIPALDHVLDIKPAGFNVVKTEDHGISVSRFDPDAEQNVVQSERTWLLTLEASAGQEKRPAAFHFGAAKIDAAEMTYQRYRDADLVNVGAEVSLEERYANPSYAWLGWSIGGGVSILALALAGAIWLRRPAPEPVATWKLPERLTPFTVLSLLKDIEQKNGFDEVRRGQLQEAMVRVERVYFADHADGSVDLKDVAETWVRQASAVRRAGE